MRLSHDGFYKEKVLTGNSRLTVVWSMLYRCTFAHNREKH